MVEQAGEGGRVNLRQLAKGQHCMIRVPGICNGDPSTTVLCHLKRGWCGTLKPPDICAVFGCFDCHNEIDGRTHASGLSRTELDAILLRALCEQLRWYLDRGIIKC